ncbi:helix-turn-helix transcriptional regulator [Bradyrhizobium sp. 31Argb]|uniref:AraC family transcriptional regulator n=1 Tax=unclassified Bradyrhizobium TaxID=2631580 RepID=UPI00249E07DA|nr:helix-turn-helix transcriptional regulator [Bradyrhizobium sp. Arg237L]MDI4238168.1 helix-turn-helix transcriptional regulator [Bradyrhizobium sp. Arg237L]
MHKSPAFETDHGFARMNLPDLRINYDPIDPDQFDRPIVSFCIETGQDNDELPLHSHKKGQLVVASHGSVMCRAPGGLWIVPPQGAVWIPAGVLHSNRVSDNGKVYVVFIDPLASMLPTTCCTFTISSLVRELIHRLSVFPPLYPIEGPTSRLGRVLLDELVQMSTEQMYLPISTDSRLQHLAVSLLNDPADRSTVEELAARYAMSERTFARLVFKETGMTFGRWRQRLHILVALQRLSAGSSVQAVSLDLGYETPSAFITMFKKTMGKSPRRFLAERSSFISHEPFA